MQKKTNLIDFHAHLMTAAGLEKICPQTQKSEFFRYVVPILEPIAQLTEPFHDCILRYIAMKYNNKFSRFIYSQCGRLFLMEALRLFRNQGLERLIRSMDRVGINHTVVCSLEPLTYTQEILDKIEPYRSRFTVFGSICSSMPDPLAYLAPFIETGKIKGIKIHSMVGDYSPDEFCAKTSEVVSLADEYGLPVSIHTGQIPVENLLGLSACNKIEVVEPLVSNFPKCQFVLNHIGWESWRQALDLARKYDNIMFETSWQPARVIRRAVDAVGAGRVMFGSDFPMFQQWQALREVKLALSPDEFAMVASQNALNLLKLDPVLLSQDGNLGCHRQSD